MAGVFCYPKCYQFRKTCRFSGISWGCHYVLDATEEQVRAEYLEVMVRLKSELSELDIFPENEMVKAVTVMTLTCEGVLRFGDESEFSKICLDFVNRKMWQEATGN